MSTRTLIAATRREVSELQAARAKGVHIPVAIGAVILVMGAMEVAVHSSLVNGVAAGPIAYVNELRQPAALLGAIYIAHVLGPGVARSALLLLAAVLIPTFIVVSPNAVVEVVGFAAFLAITLTAVRMIGHRRLLASRLEALYRSAALVSSSIDPDDVLRRVLTATRDILGYRYVAIFSIEGDRLIPTTWSGYDDVPHDLSMRRGITGRAARTGAPQLVPDVASDPEFVSGMAAPQSEIAYPLRVDEEVIGVLNVETAAPQVLGPDDLELLGSLAVQVGVALRHARQHRRIQVLATRDGLTGLHNHAAFQERLREELARADRHGRSVAVVIADLDNFKAVNDTYGHPAGDVVLRHFADLLLTVVRNEDVTARYGGEEFAVIMPDTDRDGAYVAAERIRARIERDLEVRIGGSTARVTASFGVAAYPAQAASATALIEAADGALYAAKRAGKNATRAA